MLRVLQRIGKRTPTDGGSGFVITCGAVMHHIEVDGKRIARPRDGCQSIFLRDCCGNSHYRSHLCSQSDEAVKHEKYEAHYR